MLRTLLLVALSASALGAVPAAAGGQTGPARTPASCAACTDFYAAVNAAWRAHATFAPDLPVAGTGVDVLRRNQDGVRRILDRAASLGGTLPADGTNDLHKAGRFYATCMDTSRANVLGAAAADVVLARVAGEAGSASTLPVAVADAALAGAEALFAPVVLPDPGVPGTTVLFLEPAELGLPARALYLDPDSASVRLRALYTDHVARTLVLAGDTPADARTAAGQVLDLETRLARAMLSPAARRDPLAVYHPLAPDSLARLAPGFGWSAYFATLGRADLRRVNVTEPSFAREVGRAAAEASPSSWRAYLRWRVLQSGMSALGAPAAAERARFTTLLSGARAARPRWQVCLADADRAFGQAIGREFVAQYFPPAARRRAEQMVSDLREALGVRLRQATWLSDTTRAAALRKIARLRVRVGYPDVWRSYRDVTVDPRNYYASVAAANAAALRWDLAHAGSVGDDGTWPISPQTLDALYSPFSNEMILPAGILQPPFFDPRADNAANYGAIGVIIGHEITHGYDDRGRQFDADGRLADWWTAGDAARFSAQATRLVAQYAAYHAIDDSDALRVDGRLTLGENLADLGGVLLAHDALARAEQRQRAAGRPLAGRTASDRRFFTSYAVAFRSKLTPELARARAAADPHAPARWRVNGALVNVPAFAEAFACPPGSAMAAPDSVRVRVW